MKTNGRGAQTTNPLPSLITGTTNWKGAKEWFTKGAEPAGIILFPKGTATIKPNRFVVKNKM